MFPAGVAGFALLCVRVGASAMFVSLVWAQDSNNFDWIRATCSVLAFGLCVGVLTPYVCALCCVMELGSFSWLSWTEIAHQSFLVLVTASLAGLGPGAYSVDAKLFGRRVIKQ